MPYRILYSSVAEEIESRVRSKSCNVYNYMVCLRCLGAERLTARVQRNYDSSCPVPPPN